MSDDLLLTERLRAARELSWQHFGKAITFYLPGMFRLNGASGKYPALSVTGSTCALQCDHCRGKILAAMIPAKSPKQLVSECLRLARQGNHGVLISGGCDNDGCLPWEQFARAVKKVKAATNLFVSVHCGLIDDQNALRLKQSGVDQALIDVIGDDETYRKVYHVPFGITKIEAAMASLQRAEIPIIPHIVCGIDSGTIRGEQNAVAMISRFKVQQVVVVSLMGLPDTPMAAVRPPAAKAVADIIAAVRFKLPQVPISLGCARQRGNSRLEVMAIDAGINRLALPSDEAVDRAAAYGLNIRYQATCCSVSNDLSATSW